LAKPCIPFHHAAAKSAGFIAPGFKPAPWPIAGFITPGHMPGNDAPIWGSAAISLAAWLARSGLVATAVI
jgi:hypothetical protein